jgi:hypothetical protein
MVSCLGVQMGPVDSTSLGIELKRKAIPAHPAAG